MENKIVQEKTLSKEEYAKLKEDILKAYEEDKKLVRSKVTKKDKLTKDLLFMYLNKEFSAMIMQGLFPNLFFILKGTGAAVEYNFRGVPKRQFIRLTLTKEQFEILKELPN